MCDLEFLTTLGSGAYGEVYLVEHKPTNKKYAFKLCRKGFCNADKADPGIGISPNEYTILYNITHRNLAQAISIPGLTSEQIANCSTGFKSCILSEVALYDLKHLKPPSANNHTNVAKILYDIACGVEALHEAGYYHLDIKAANCLLYPDDTHQYRAVLSDFGSAIHMSTKYCGFPKCTVTHRPPEIKWFTLFELTPYIDVFSFGVLMAELTVLDQFKYDKTKTEQQNIKQNREYILIQCQKWKDYVNQFTAAIEDANSIIPQDEKEEQAEILNSWWGGIGAKAMLQIISQIEKAVSVVPRERGTITYHREMLEGIGMTYPYIIYKQLMQGAKECTDEDFRLYVIMRDIMKSKTCSDFPVRMLFSAFHLYMITKNDPNVISDPRRKTSNLSPGELAFGFLSVVSYIYDVEFSDNLYFTFKKTFSGDFPGNGLIEVTIKFCKLRERIERCETINKNFNGINAFDTCKSKQEVMNLVNSNDNSLLKNIYYKNNVFTQTEKVGNDVMHLTMKDVEDHGISGYILNIANWFNNLE